MEGYFYQDECPSPDWRENPFLQKKNLVGKRETAPNPSDNELTA